MRWIKKLLRIVAILLPSIAFALCISDPSHALSHEYGTLPYFVYHYPSITLSDRLTVVYANSDLKQDLSGFPNPTVFQPYLNNGTCEYYGTLSSGSTTPLSYSVGFQAFPREWPNSTFSACQQIGSLSSNPHGMNWSSVPLGIFRSLNPYWFSYSSFKLKDSYIDTDSGVRYNNSLKSSDLFGVPLNKFKELIIPLEYNSDVAGQLTQGRSLEIKGVFDFTGYPFSWGDTSSSYFKLKLRGLVGGLQSNNYAQEVDCDILLRTAGGYENYQVLEYSCPLVSNHNYSDVGLILDIGSTSDYVWDYQGDFKWAGLYAITDNDDTPGSNMDSGCLGVDCDSAPGSAFVPSDGSGGLTNLFSFNLLNPFAPLFNMFNPNQCVQIPILAGMLGATESQYCSWFPNSVRNIVTPVIGISSIMLLFGFFIRWLGGSSGNIIDPDLAGGSDGDNFKVRSKYERRK